MLMLALVLGLAPATLHATGRYVAPSGSNTNDGGIATPWMTIGVALGRLSPGDTLYIRAGHYFEAPVAAVSGAPGAEIVVRSYPGERVIVDAGVLEPQVVGNTAWELVDPVIGEYRTLQNYDGGTVYGYVDGIPGYGNGRVALVPYQSASHFRATTDAFGDSFYVGPGTFADTTTGRIHIRLSKTSDLIAAEARYGQVLEQDHADPAGYSIILSRATYTLRVSGSYLRFLDLIFHQSKGTIQLTAGVHHVTFDGVTAWLGARSIEVTGADVHDVTVTRCRLFGDHPYWIFWSDMKDPPAPAAEMRASTLDLRYGAHDWEISYNHIRGSGQDLIGTNTSEYNLRIHHNRLENAGDDALELEGTVSVGRIEVYENYILNCLTAVAPGQGTPAFPGPLFVYRNLICLLRDPPVNRLEGLNSWNGGKRFGFEYMFKQNGPTYSTANAHYYHNTMVMLNTASRGLNLTPRYPADTRIANNLCVMVNGVVNDIYLTDVGQVVDGNLYWKVNTVDTAPLVDGFDDVPAFNAATGLEPHGLGGVPKRGTNPRFVSFNPQIVDTTQGVWAIAPASENPALTSFLLGTASPARDAAIVIPPHPVHGALPDTRAGADIGAIPYGTPTTEWTMFPFAEVVGVAAGIANDAPSVEAGPVQSLSAPGSVTLAGAVVDDLVPSPSALTTLWEQVSGPVPVSFADPTAATTQANFPQPGLYLLRLTASDGLASASDSTIVSVRPLLVVERRVAAGSDDAEESTSGSVSLTSSDIEMMNAQRAAGVRFTQLGIPAGALITLAYVQFKADETQSGVTTLTLYGQATANPPTFTSGTANLWNRARTAGAVTWSPAAWTTIGSAGAEQRTPNLAPLIQEIVNGAAQPVDNLVLIITGIGHRTADSFEGDPTSAALLHVEFTLPAILAADDRTPLPLAPQVLPHPMPGRGALRFATRRIGPALIELHDTQGRRVRTVLRVNELAAGAHWIPLDGRDDRGERLRSGVYFYRLSTTEGVASGRVLILR